MEGVKVKWGDPGWGPRHGILLRRGGWTVGLPLFLLHLIFKMVTIRVDKSVEITTYVSC